MTSVADMTAAIFNVRYTSNADIHRCGGHGRTDNPELLRQRTEFLEFKLPWQWIGPHVMVVLSFARRSVQNGKR